MPEKCEYLAMLVSKQDDEKCFSVIGVVKHGYCRSSVVPAT